MTTDTKAQLIRAMVEFLQEEGYSVRHFTELQSAMLYRIGERHGGLGFNFDVLIPQQHLQVQYTFTPTQVITGEAADPSLQMHVAKHLGSKIAFKMSERLAPEFLLNLKQGVEKAREQAQNTPIDLG